MAVSVLNCEATPQSRSSSLLFEPMNLVDGNRNTCGLGVATSRRLNRRIGGTSTMTSSPSREEPSLEMWRRVGITTRLNGEYSSLFNGWLELVSTTWQPIS